MMSRVGLELTNFINPDLTWKTVSKGYRTGTRRSRKQGTNNWKVGAELVDSSGKMVEDAETTVSESEKLGVAVLGRRFGDKIEQIPIKKRRFMFRSPSPPSRSCAPSFEEAGQLVNSQLSRSQVRSKSTARKQLKTSAASTVKSVHTTDFSGIEILADVACSNSIGDDALVVKGSLAVESKHEIIDSSTSGGPPQEALASSDATNCSQKYIIHEERKDNTVACLQNHPSHMNDGMAKNSASLRDDRLHWDLNVSMDAWEQPPEIDSQENSVEGVAKDSWKGDMPQISECRESRKEDTKHNMGSTGNSAVGSLGTSDASEDVNRKSLIPEACESNIENNKLECSGVDKNYGIPAPASGDHAQESSMEVAENVKASIQVVRKDHLCSLPEDVTSLQVVEDSKISIIVEQKPKVDDKQKDEHDASACNLDNGQVINCDVASTCELVPEKVACMTDDSILNEVVGDPGKMLGLDAMNSQGSCPPSPVPFEPANKAEEMCVVSPSAKSEGMSASDVPVGEGQHGATVYSNGHEDKAVVLNIDKADSLHCIESSSVGAPWFDACNKNGSSSTSSSDKVSLDLQPVSGFYSDVCQDGKGCSVSMEKNEQDGYDSQFEDGELRETDLCWNNDDGEAEFVDYGSDNGEAFDKDVAGYSGKVEVGSECDKEGTCVSQADMEKKIKPDSSNLDTVSDHLIENGQCSKDALRESGWPEIIANPTSGIIECGTIKKQSADCVDKLDMTDIPTRATGSKSSRKELQPSTGTHLSPDGVPIRRGRPDNLDDSYPRVERQRSALHFRSRSPGGGPSFNPSGSFRDSKRAHSPTYYGSYNSGRTRPKSAVEGQGYAMASDNAVAGLDNRMRRPFINSSNGVYRPHVRRRSPSEREDASYGMGPVREISPDRRRFRRYPQGGINRGFREEYHRQLPEESIEYPNRFRMTRRQRSISPPCGRAPPPHYPQPFRKSRSRSRSRSPIGWLLPRNRNEGPRQRSRSPEFRSKGRIERTRVPFQRAGFEPGYEEGLMSPPGNRFSPPRNSRWFEDRNGGVDHMRGRRSPVRMIRPNQRFDSVRPMRRMNSSDDGFRAPMMHGAGRYGDVYPGGGRGRKYEGGEDDRRKNNGERYEVINRVRRYDSDGPVRRFRYDTEDCFLAKNSNYNYDECNRSKRDVLPRRGSEEKDQQSRPNQDQQPRLNQEPQPRFNQDNKVNNTSPKSLAVLEGETT